MASEREPLLAGGGAGGMRPASFKELAQTFITLGFTAFGGPQAHMGLYQNIIVDKYGP